MLVPNRGVHLFPPPPDRPLFDVAHEAVGHPGHGQRGKPVLPLGQQPHRQAASVQQPPGDLQRLPQPFRGLGQVEHFKGELADRGHPTQVPALIRFRRHGERTPQPEEALHIRHHERHGQHGVNAHRHQGCGLGRCGVGERADHDGIAEARAEGVHPSGIIVGDKGRIEHDHVRRVLAAWAIASATVTTPVARPPSRSRMARRCSLKSWRSLTTSTWHP